MKKEELIEILATIEHQRWADWQKWCHQVYRQGDFEKYMERWEKQIATAYSDLSEEDKEKDRLQVKRYFHFIEDYSPQNQ